VYYLFYCILFLNKKKIEIKIFISIVIILIHTITYKMFNPDFKNEKVNYEMMNVSVIGITTICVICASYQFSIVINIMFKNIIIFGYKWLDIYIMVSLLVTAFIIFTAFKGLADELNNIFVKLNDSIIEKDKKIKELEDKLVTNNIKISKLQNENREISKLLDENIDNLMISLSIEENVKKQML